MKVDHTLLWLSAASAYCKYKPNNSLHHCKSSVNLSVNIRVKINLELYWQQVIHSQSNTTLQLDIYLLYYFLVLQKSCSYHPRCQGWLASCLTFSGSHLLYKWIIDITW